MTHTYAAYKRPTSEQKTYKDWKWRAAKKKYSKQMDRKKKTRVVIFILDKIDFKKKGPQGETQKVTWWIQKKNLSRRHKHCKYICTQHRSTHIHKENLGGLKQRYCQQDNYSRGVLLSISFLKSSKIFLLY